MIRRDLASESPVDLLATASGLLAVLDRPRRHPLEDADDQVVTIEQFATMLGEEESRESMALLAAIGQLSGAEVLRRRSEKSMQRSDLPSWLCCLGDACVKEARR